MPIEIIRPDDVEPAEPKPEPVEVKSISARTIPGSLAISYTAGRNENTETGRVKQTSNSVYTLQGKLEFELPEINIGYKSGREVSLHFEREQGNRIEVTGYFYGQLPSPVLTSSFTRTTVKNETFYNGKTRRDEWKQKGSGEVRVKSFHIILQDGRIQQMHLAPDPIPFEGEHSWHDEYKGTADSYPIRGGESRSVSAKYIIKDGKPVANKGCTIQAETVTLNGHSFTVTCSRPTGASVETSEEVTIALEIGRNVELKYHKADYDVARLAYAGGKPAGENVYNMPGGNNWLPHANFEGEVWVDDVNRVTIRKGELLKDQSRVESDYIIDRRVRSWQLDSSGKRQEDVPSWEFDVNNTFPLLDWIDPAGVSFVLGPPDTWPRRGVLDEFLVGVQNAPEFEYIYIAYAMEIRKNAYRILYSDPKRINEEEYREIRRSQKPLFAGFKDDKGWISLTKVKGEWKVAE